MAKRIDILAHLPGFHREYTTKDGKKTNQRFVSEDGQISLSVRQAQEVAHGKKPLSEAIATSFKGKRVGGLGWKIPTDSYEFKDLFDARSFVMNSKSLHDKKMFLTARGQSTIIYESENKTKFGVWRAPLSVVSPATYTSDKYWEKTIDRLGDAFIGDPNTIAITFVG